MKKLTKKTIAIVTDTWLKNTSGVVTALKHTKKGLEEKGFKVAMIHPGLFFSVWAATFLRLPADKAPNQRTGIAQKSGTRKC